MFSGFHSGLGHQALQRADCTWQRAIAAAKVCVWCGEGDPTVWMGMDQASTSNTHLGFSQVKTSKEFVHTTNQQTDTSEHQPNWEQEHFLHQNHGTLAHSSRLPPISLKQPHHITQCCTLLDTNRAERKTMEYVASIVYSHKILSMIQYYLSLQEMVEAMLEARSEYWPNQNFPKQAEGPLLEALWKFQLRWDKKSQHERLALVAHDVVILVHVVKPIQKPGMRKQVHMEVGAHYFDAPPKHPKTEKNITQNAKWKSWWNGNKPLHDVIPEREWRGINEFFFERRNCPYHQASNPQTNKT